MNTTRCSACVGFLAIAALGVFATPVEATSSDESEVVLEWNQLLQTNIPPTAALFSFRYFAMMHIAMFDAVNSIEREYRRYHVRVPANPAASPEAAAAQAAHDVLVALIPSAEATFDAALESRLATIQPAHRARGVEVGKKVARAIIAWRTGDGSELPTPPYLPPPLPGLWQPTAPGQVATFVHFANVEPFGLLTATQYLPKPPPFLNSSQYATDFAQAQRLGSVDSAARTAEQTLLANVFAGNGYVPGPLGLWNVVAVTVTKDLHLSLIEAARLFALLNAAMNDGLQTSHTSKFIYGLWRPVTAIQRADEDLNDETLADTEWTPLLATPPYPSHASNLACVATSAARTLRRTLGTDEVLFEVTWTGTGGNADETRSYTRFSQLAREGGLSRIYGGIHFLFEVTASRESCRQVANYIFRNHARPLP